jgi:hypothetical protein
MESILYSTSTNQNQVLLRQAFLQSWAWALAEQHNLSALADPTLAESEVQENAESIARMTKVSPRLDDQLHYIQYTLLVNGLTDGRWVVT